MTWRPARWGAPPADGTTDSEKLAAILAVVDEEVGACPDYEVMRLLTKILDILTER